MAALTTKERVKERLQIASTGHDAFIDTLINAVSSYIEGYTGRRFERADYEEQMPTWPDQRIYYVQNPPIITLTAVQYRTGTPDNPTWVDFDAGDYEVMQEGNDPAAGIVFYAGLPVGVNQIKVKYTGGYLIDWTNAGDPTKHNLPEDLVELATYMVAALYRRRNKEGKVRETTDANSVEWRDTLPDMYRHILDRYSNIIV